MKIARVLAQMFALVVLSVSPCYGYDKNIAHRELSELAVNESILLNEYLVSYLGLPQGIRHRINGKSILERIQEGSKTEDEPTCRPSNHFHNPLNFISWADSYMNDEPFFVECFCSLSGWGEKRSAVTWATRYLAAAPGGDRILTGNEWDWDSAMLSFRQALTAETAADREQAFADTFRSLGQVLHLLQDMGVPAHVRNDFRAHLEFNGFGGGWCPLSWFGNGYEYYVSRHRNHIRTATPIRPLFSEVTLTNFWDTNIYDSGCQDTLPRRSGRDLGMSEYTNANFLSSSTTFTENKQCDDEYFFPHPRLDETTLDPEALPVRLYEAEDGVTDSVHLIEITDTEGLVGSEDPDRVIAAVRYLAIPLMEEDPTVIDYYDRDFFLNDDDDAVHEDTAARLIPRVAGYSAALLDHFFRGRFEVTAVEGTLTVRNLYPSGADGAVTIYADAPDGRRSVVQGFNALPVILGAAGEVDDTATWMGFSPPETEGLQYTMVFEGLLDIVGATSGQENAIAGRVFTWDPGAGPSDVIPVGDNPHGLALNPDGSKLYVTNSRDNTVSVINTSDGSLLAELAVGSTPVDVVVTPDGSRAFVSNERGRSVSVIDAVNDIVTNTITGLSSWPEDMAVTPDGQYVYLAHWSWSPLTRIDTSTLSTTVFTSPLRPGQGIAIHPFNPTAYLTYYTFYWRNSVGVIDLGTHTLDATIPGPDLNWSAAVDVSGNYLYVAHPQLNAVGVYNTVFNSLETTLPVGGSPRGVAAGPEGMIYAANLLDDTVSVIDSSTNSVVGTIAAGDGAYDVAVSPDGRYLYVSNAFADTVSVIPLSGGVAEGLVAATTAASATAGLSLTSVFLENLPPGSRVFADGEFPRMETQFEAGLEVSFPAGDRELFLACPGYISRTISVSTVAGDYLVLDGGLVAE